jgi:hypothetical protein
MSFQFDIAFVFGDVLEEDIDKDELFSLIPFMSEISVIVSDITSRVEELARQG